MRKQSRANVMWPALVAAAILFVCCAPKKEAREETMEKPQTTETPQTIEKPQGVVTPPPATPSPGAPTGEFSVDGTVLKLPVEGGCWVIRTLEGTEYEPINLKGEYQVEGTRVRALLVARSDMASTCKVGTIVEIANIEHLE